MKRYKAIFFDWDGTAVISRAAPADEVAAAMRPLLRDGVKLAVISGTTYENIAGGKLAKFFSPQERRNLCLGLGRGAYNFGFDENGVMEQLGGVLPDREIMAAVHRVSFELHDKLFRDHGFNTDIVFNRPNYCKIDLLADVDRGDQLFFQADEAQKVLRSLAGKGWEGGLKGLIELARETGGKYGLDIAATTDAKYLEVGLSTKSDNVDFLLGRFEQMDGIAAEACCFWGDEYLEIGDGVFGSDSYMYTQRTKHGDFYDVSDSSGVRPEFVRRVGGGVGCFHDFLLHQPDCD